MIIHSIVGARPNFVKIASLEKAFQAFPQVEFRIIHTGQHYDASLDTVFFRQLAIPAPDYHLGIGSDTPIRQLGQMLLGLEPVFKKGKPDLVLVVGDTNSALAGALAASRLGIQVAHVEAGLRSGDRSMPEEINRILTDAVADFLFTTEQAASENLVRDGFSEDKIYFTGNCMIDTLVRFREKARTVGTTQKLGLQSKGFALVTLHRPSNVDDAIGLDSIVQILETICKEIQVVFPIHPRTRSNLEKHGFYDRLTNMAGLHLLEPQGYFEFLNLLENAAIAITDSGGIQDETTFLGTPCLTLRTTTERPVTLKLGTNELLPAPEPENVRLKVQQALSGNWKTGSIPPLWDGQSARRIAEILVNLFHRNN